VRRVLDLAALALRFRKQLVVRYFEDDARDPHAEGRLDLVGGGLRVLDRVVEQRGADHLPLAHAALVPQDLGERDRVVDVGRRGMVLSPLVAVLERGELQRGQDIARRVHARKIPNGHRRERMIRLQIVERPGARLFSVLKKSIRSKDLRTFSLEKGGKRVVHIRSPGYMNWVEVDGVIACEIRTPKDRGQGMAAPHGGDGPPRRSIPGRGGEHQHPAHRASAGAREEARRTR
jgi:hypothetical protein